jgi:hypothetical protein
LLGPEGGIVDIECDGPKGEESLAKLMGGEVVLTLGWSSARGPHHIFRYDPRLARYGKSVVKLPKLPDLEIRVGGDAKQLQSNCPPTVGTDGKPREWNGVWIIADLPEAAFIFLDDALTEPRPRHENVARTTAHAAKALEEECRHVALATHGEQNDALNKAAFALGQLVGAGSLERSEVERRLLDAAAGYIQKDGERAARATIRSGLDAGQDQPRDLSHLSTNRNGRTERRGNGTVTNPSPVVSAPSASQGSLVLVTTRASQVRVMPVDFLDGGVIPRGKLITLAGLGGAGKGMFCANMIADLTRGRPSLGLSYTSPPPIDVLLIGCEDGYADTVNPRLMAAGADLDRVHIVDGVRSGQGKVQPFSLRNLNELETYLAAHPNVRLVIIDPITGYIGQAGVKDHHDADVRSLLGPLADLANRRATTIIAIKHLNKDEAKTVASRVGGSVAYVNVPRACFVVANDPENKGRRVLAPFKWNLNASWPPSIAWTMQPPSPGELATILGTCDYLDEKNKERLAGQLNRLVWVGAVKVSADDLLRTAAWVERKSTQNDVDRATEWLRERLAQGPIGSIVCARDGDKALGRNWPAPAAGISPDELRRRVLGRVKWWRETILKLRLNGETRRAGFKGPYFFCLPDHETQGLWPPTPDAIRAAQRVDDEAIRPDLNGAPPNNNGSWIDPHGVHGVHGSHGSNGWGSGFHGGSARPVARNEVSQPAEVSHGSPSNAADSMASMDSMDSTEMEEGDI